MPSGLIPFAGSLLATQTGELAGAVGRDGKEYLFGVLTNSSAAFAPIPAVVASNVAINGGAINGTSVGATTPAAVTGTNVYASAELGYAAAAQGVVTQLTSKTTGVTLSKSSGQITTAADSLAALTNVTFTLTNTLLSAKDVLILNVGSGATQGAYNCWVSSMDAGTCTITLRNISASPLAEAVVINFAIIHGA